MRAHFDRRQRRGNDAQARNGGDVGDDPARQRGDEVGRRDDGGEPDRTRQHQRYPPPQPSRGEDRVDQARAAAVRADALYGYYRPDAGELRISRAPVRIASPSDARRLGVGMVFQNFSLIPALSVWENVALFLEDLPWAIDPEQIRRRMTPLAERLRLNVDFRLPAGRLAVGDQQKVEILKQLLAGARVLILDEPSSSRERRCDPGAVDALSRQAWMEVAGVRLPAAGHLGVYTQPLSFAGLPTVAAPVASTGALPLGVQIVAAPWREDLAFRVAAAAEALGASSPLPALRGERSGEGRG
jgi:hypothetical protein